MTIQDALRGAFGKNSGLEQIQKNVFRLYAPFFHEDGDMYSIYLETGDAGVTIRDYGNTLMRVSYTFDVTTPKKQTVLKNIVNSNLGEMDDGELLIRANTTDKDEVIEKIYQYTQLVAKVSNIDILSRETVKSMFYEYLNDFVMKNLQSFHVEKGFHPTNDRELEVDYMIPGSRPIYLFGVNGDTKASRTVISCLTFQKREIPFRSVIVHEDLNALTGFNRRQITNVSDKQFSTFPDFAEQGADYLARERSA